MSIRQAQARNFAVLQTLCRLSQDNEPVSCTSIAYESGYEISDVTASLQLLIGLGMAVRVGGRGDLVPACIPTGEGRSYFLRS